MIVPARRLFAASVLLGPGRRWPVRSLRSSSPTTFQSLRYDQKGCATVKGIPRPGCLTPEAMPSRFAHPPDNNYACKEPDG